MGFTLADPDRFYASGHPGEGTDLPNPVGLLESRAAGLTWSQLSRQGQPRLPRAYGLTGGRRGQRRHPAGRPGWSAVARPGRSRPWHWPPPPTATPSSPPRRNAQVQRRGTDLAAPPGAPPLKVLSWAADGTAVGATFDGAVHVSTDTGVAWQRRGRTPPAAGHHRRCRGRTVRSGGDRRGRARLSGRRHHVHTAAEPRPVGRVSPGHVVQRRARLRRRVNHCPHRERSAPTARDRCVSLRSRGCRARMGALRAVSIQAPAP
jgi:hypothetical protein